MRFEQGRITKKMLVMMIEEVGVNKIKLILVVVQVQVVVIDVCVHVLIIMWLYV